MRLVTIGAALVLGLAALSVTPAPASAQQPNIQRKVLLTQDLPIAGYQIVMAAVEIPAGGREGRHTHPGALVVYIQEGALVRLRRQTDHDLQGRGFLLRRGRQDPRGHQ